MAIVFRGLLSCRKHFKNRLFYTYTATTADPFCDSNSTPAPCVDLLDYQLGQSDLPGVCLDTSTYASLLQHCALANALCQGRVLHLLLAKTGYDLDVFIKNHLIHMYGKCNALHEARALFSNMSGRNVFSWNIVIGLHAQHRGHGIHDVVKFFLQMHMEGVLPDKVTFVNLLSSVCSHDFAVFGKRLHSSLVASGLELDVVVGTALISMYSICNNLGKARSLFNRMPTRNVVSWSAMIGACAHHNQGKEALQLFSEMELQGFVPNEMMLVSCLSACATLAAQTIGFDIHTLITSIGCEENTVVGTALVDMYCKSGSLEQAEVTFDKMRERNVLSWTIMMAAYAMHGQSKQVISLHEQMQTKGPGPDDIYFLCALSACSHLGLPEESYFLFGSMRRHYGITPAIEHFNCIIDLLGRVGRLDEGEVLTSNMPCHANDSSWLSLLAACKMHFDVERAQRTAGCILRMDTDNAASCLLLWSIL